MAKYNSQQKLGQPILDLTSGLRLPKITLDFYFILFNFIDTMNVYQNESPV